MNIFKFKISLIILLLVHLSPSFGKTTASVNQTTVYEDDPLILTIESSQSTQAPDLRPLNMDFTLVSSSTSSQINIINGQRSFKKSWIIKLLPKNLGQYDIPAIQVGNETTTAIPLNVTILPPEVKAETEKHITINSFIGSDKTPKASTKKDTYVQQQIPYTVKLLYDSSMLSGEINEPNIESAVVEKLGRDKHYNIRKAGKKFSVIEKHYVISPEKSGPLTIPPAIVKGKVALSDSDSKNLRRKMDDTDMLNRFFDDINGFRNDPFFNDPFNDGFFRSRSRAGLNKPFSASTKAIEVNILPIPNKFTGKNWLPAEALSLTDSWAKNPPDLKIGEPVVRTLTLQAKGLAGSQIPSLALAKPENMKIYPEPANTETRTDGLTVYGIQQIDVSYIPSKSGEITIPEIKLDWWNLKTKKQQALVLPKWTLHVAPGAIKEETIAPSSDTSETAQGKEKTKKSIEKVISDPNNTANPTSAHWLIIGLGTLLLIGAGIIGYIFYQRTKSSSPLSTSHQNTPINMPMLKNVVLDACNKNDNHAAAKHLLELIRAQWNDSSILNLGIMVDDMANGASVIEELEKSLYSSQSSTWNGKSLHKLVSNGIVRKTEEVTKNKDFLESLYPVTSN